MNEHNIFFMGTGIVIGGLVGNINEYFTIGIVVGGFILIFLSGILDILT